MHRMQRTEVQGQSDAAKAPSINRHAKVNEKSQGSFCNNNGVPGGPKHTTGEPKPFQGQGRGTNMVHRKYQSSACKHESAPRGPKPSTGEPKLCKGQGRGVGMTDELKAQQTKSNQIKAQQGRGT